MKPLRESAIEDEWHDLIAKSWNLPCDKWEKMMKARANGNEGEAKDIECTVADYYDNLIEDLKKELVSQGYRKDIVERRVEQSMGFDILRDAYYTAIGEATGIDSEEDIKNAWILVG